MILRANRGLLVRNWENSKALIATSRESWRAQAFPLYPVPLAQDPGATHQAQSVLTRGPAYLGVEGVTKAPPSLPGGALGGIARVVP